MKPFTILYADDDEDDIYLFCEVIKNIQDIECITAENGIKALEILRNKKIDLVFLDLNMPLLDGFHCLIKIKGDDLLKEIPVIIYSTSHREREKCLKAGASDFLVKAQTFKTMKENLIALLNRFRTALAKT